MSTFEVTARPILTNRAAKFASTLKALETLTTDSSIRGSWTEKEISNIRQLVRYHHPQSSLRTRRLPDGIYMWLETRSNGNGQ